MTNQEIRSLLEKQRSFYRIGATIPVSFRIEQLKKLYAAVKKYENEIHDALKSDLGKSNYESFMCESGLVLSEISFMIRHTRRFAGRKTVYTPLAQFASHSYKQPVPYGNTLIMSPWNYPFLLTMDPLADAIAAGNTAIVKPSAYSPATGRVIQQIIRSCFPPEYVAVVTGGRAERAPVLWMGTRTFPLPPGGSSLENFSTADRPVSRRITSSATAPLRTRLYPRSSVRSENSMATSRWITRITERSSMRSTFTGFAA